MLRYVEPGPGPAQVQASDLDHNINTNWIWSWPGKTVSRKFSLFWKIWMKQFSNTKHTCTATDIWTITNKCHLPEMHQMTNKNNILTTGPLVSWSVLWLQSQQQPPCHEMVCDNMRRPAEVGPPPWDHETYQYQLFSTQSGLMTGTRAGTNNTMNYFCPSLNWLRHKYSVFLLQFWLFWDKQEFKVIHVYYNVKYLLNTHRSSLGQ